MKSMKPCFAPDPTGSPSEKMTSQKRKKEMSVGHITHITLLAIKNPPFSRTSVQVGKKRGVSIRGVGPVRTYCNLTLASPFFEAPTLA